MKEATGELNMTVITVIAIAAIALIFTTLVLPGIRRSIERNTNCSNAISCQACTGNTRTCTYVDANDQPQTQPGCPCN